MTSRAANLIKLAALVGAVLALVAIGVAAMPHLAIKEWLNKHKASAQGSEDRPRESSAKLAAGKIDAIELPPEVVERLGVQTAKIKRATKPRELELVGSLTLDTDTLQLVHATFPGEVVGISSPEGADHEVPSPSRQLRVGDRVREGQLLAVI